jgi:tRNA A-37 threonylcarbamoyl transferase component Bud32
MTGELPLLSFDQIADAPRELLRHGRTRVAADLYAIEWNGRPAVLKDVSRCPWIVRIFYARPVMLREIHVLKKLQDVQGVPRVLALVGNNAFIMERVQAQPLPHPRATTDRPPREFFEKMMNLLASLHRRGVGHGDFRRSNVMMDEQNQPFIIDYATAVIAKPGVLGAWSRFLYRLAVKTDTVHALEIKECYYPDALAAEERHIIHNPPLLLQIGRFLRQTLYRKFFKKIFLTRDKRNRKQRRRLRA